MAPGWLLYSLIAVALWGVVGLLQKLGTNRISADSLLVWMMGGYLLLLPFLLPVAHLSALGSRDLLLGTLVGISNGLGAWALFASLANGAKASIAIPLTGLYPVVTVILALVFLHERPQPLSKMIDDEGMNGRRRCSGSASSWQPPPGC